MAIKRTLLALATGTLTPLTDAQIARYDYVITQFDRQSRMAGAKALNPAQKWFCYQNSLLTNNLGSTGVSKTEMDANPTWFLRTLQTETFENSVLRDTPPHFWKLQETSGTTAADSGSSPANGTYNANQTLNQASLTGNASLKSVLFGNVGGFPTGFALSGTTNYTFEGWAVRTDSTSVDTIIGSDGASGNRIILRCASGSNDIAFYADSNIGGSSWFGALPAPGTAFHWALTWDYVAQDAELFINGVSKGVNHIGNAINSANVGNLTIGSWHSDLAHDPFKGRISHVAAWTTKLSAGRIAAHAANGPNTTTGGGAIIESTLFSTNWIADISNSAYQTRWKNNVIALLAAGGWDGVFVDDLDIKYSSHSGDVQAAGLPSDPYTVYTDAQFKSNEIGSLIPAIYTPIHSAGYTVIGNIANALTDSTDYTAWITALDGASREFYKKYGTGDSSAITPVQPASGNSRFIDGDFDFDQLNIGYAQAASRIFIPITYGVSTDLKIQRYINAASLLEWNGTSSLAIAFSISGTGDPYSVYWTKDIGTPTGAKFNVLSDPNTWVRQFTKGIVCVNSSASSKTFDLTPYGPMLKADGSAAGTSLVVPAGEAEILSFVIGTDSGAGTDASTRSAAIPATDSGAGVNTEAVTGLAPTNSAVPAITGTAQAGEVLSASTGVWNNFPTGYTYQWYRCDAAGASCVAKVGATNPTYTVQATDVGFTIRVTVTAINPFGSASAQSLATALVTAAVIPPLPAEVPATEAEQNFLDESPPGFFPENQNSNFGIRRKVFSDQAQLGADQLSEIYAERFLETANTYLDEWERMMGVPFAPPTLDLTTRRSRILGRLRQGPFTHEARRDLVERYIQATFGAVPFFTSGGIPILGGIPLHSAEGIVTQYYRIYENVSNFSYDVWVDSVVGVDTAGLTRELTFLTPSGISYTIDQAHTGVGLIDWKRTVQDLAPNGWWKLDADYNDFSGLANHGTVTGAPTAIASPGLLSCAPGETNAARDFSGTAQYVTVADNATLRTPDFTVFAIVRPDALPTSGNRQFIYSINSNNFLAIENLAGTGNVFELIMVDTGAKMVASTTTPVIGTTYRIAVTFNGVTGRLYVNGVEQGTPIVLTQPPVLTGSKFIGAAAGGSSPWNGGLDEVLNFPYTFSAAQALYLSKQAANSL